MKYKFSQKMINYWFNQNKYYSIGNVNKFIKYFFPIDNFFILNNNSNEKILNLYDIQETNIKKNKNELNVIVCVENCYYHKHYNHYNVYGNFEDKNIDIYFYNHIDRLIITENFICIPVIYSQINYFNKFYKEIYTEYYDIPFENKKFCLFLTINGFNSEIKNNFYNILQKIEKCDKIDNFKHLIGDKSCYHSTQFLKLINQYKFCFVCENSISDGYITEKIFNCFLGKSIPIYYGSPIADRFFNLNSFIYLNNILEDNLITKIKEINYNKAIFQNYIDSPKININYDDENYSEQLKKFILSK